MSEGTVRRTVELYDTTLRDGAQQTGLSYSIEDRMRILHKIDQLGVPFIEGGWPGANPRDTEFFKLATKETLQHAALTSFGMTRKAGERAEDSAVLRELLETGTEVVCIVGKAWDVHVTEVLRTDLDEGVAMVRDSVAFLRAQDRRVFFDAEHFFDGYRSNPAYAMDVLKAAEEAGAERSVLCDTNGGMLPADIARIVDDVVARTAQAQVGIHVHNDAGCAVANSLIAVEHGAFQVQGVVNGYGERTGNADLIPIAANLVLKMGADCLPAGAEERLTEVAHFVAEVANLAPDSRQPYAGRYAFTHKAGLHASGVARLEEAYEHVRPASVGNRRGIVASDLGGAATLRMKAEEFEVDLPEESVGRLVTELKERESRGYTFEVADASLELLMRRAGGWEQSFFTIESFRVHIEQRMEDEEEALAEATVKVVTNGTRHIESAEGHGPVGALDNALRKGAHERVPGARRHDARGLPRPCAGRDGRDRCDRARPDRYLERRARMDHGRRVGEHHRGIVGSARRRLPVRPAPSAGGPAGVSAIDDVAIRDATPSDSRAIAEVHVASWRWAYRDDLPAEFLDGQSVEAREREWDEWLAPDQPGAGTMVAETDDGVVGFCSFAPSRDDDAPAHTAEVLTIYLLRDAAGRGIGRELFASAVGRLAELGYERATLWVMASNDRSRRFYEAAGWSWDGTTSEHRFDCANVPIVRYVLDL